jgi:hypothetical protein
LKNPETLYRRVTDQIANVISAQVDSVTKLREIFGQFEPSAGMANAIYYEQTGFHRPSMKDIRCGDLPGPLFHMEGPMHERVGNANGIRLLGLALGMADFEVVEFLADEGARIPQRGIDWPEDAEPPQIGASPLRANDLGGEGEKYSQEECVATAYRDVIRNLIEGQWQNLPRDLVERVLETLGYNQVGS